MEPLKAYLDVQGVENIADLGLKEKPADVPVGLGIASIRFEYKEVEEDQHIGTTPEAQSLNSLFVALTMSEPNPNHNPNNAPANVNGGANVPAAPPNDAEHAANMRIIQQHLPQGFAVPDNEACFRYAQALRNFETDQLGIYQHPGHPPIGFIQWRLQMQELSRPSLDEEEAMSSISARVNNRAATIPPVQQAPAASSAPAAPASYHQDRGRGSQNSLLERAIASSDQDLGTRVASGYIELTAKLSDALIGMATHGPRHGSGYYGYPPRGNGKQGRGAYHRRQARRAQENADSTSGTASTQATATTSGNSGGPDRQAHNHTNRAAPYPAPIAIRPTNGQTNIVAPPTRPSAPAPVQNRAGSPMEEDQAPQPIIPGTNHFAVTPGEASGSRVTQRSASSKPPIPSHTRPRIVRLPWLTRPNHPSCPKRHRAFFRQPSRRKPRQQQSRTRPRTFRQWKSARSRSGRRRQQRQRRHALSVRAVLIFSIFLLLLFLFFRLATQAGRASVRTPY